MHRPLRRSRQPRQTRTATLRYLPVILAHRQTSQMYLVATGGSVGSNDANPNLSMMTALGSCSELGSSSVMVNEVTTVASVWATAPFADNDVLNGNSSYLYLGTSSGNLTGLANAFAAMNNLVDISTGQARFLLPPATGRFLMWRSILWPTF